MTQDLAQRLQTVVRASDSLMEALRLSRSLALPDWMLVSGSVYQTVWNDLTGRPSDYGIRDYDLAYHDASDITYEGEDVHIRRAAAFPAPYGERIEVRNQARVHLWFETHFGEPYSPVASSTEALTRFVAPCFAVGVRLEPDDALTIAAPMGLADLFDMTIRPNPDRPKARDWDRIIASAQGRWPELKVVEG